MKLPRLLLQVAESPPLLRKEKAEVEERVITTTTTTAMEKEPNSMATVTSAANMDTKQ